MLQTFLLAWLGLTLIAPGGFLLLCSLWLLQRRRFQPKTPSFPPLSVIRPLRGAGHMLEATLRSTFDTGYPGDIELICAVETPDDPAVAIVEALKETLPEHPITLVVSHGRGSIFGKHANLIAGYQASRHETVVFSDAESWLPPGILEELIPPLEHPDIGGSTALFHQQYGTGYPNQLMAIFIEAYGYVPNLGARQIAMQPNVVGGLMAFRKRTIEVMGGLAHIIAERISDDGALGVALTKHRYIAYVCGKPFRLLRHPDSFGAVLRNVHRWVLMFKGQAPVSFLQMTLINPCFPLTIYGLCALFGLVPRELFLPLAGLSLGSELVMGAASVILFHPDEWDRPLPPGLLLGRPLAQLLIFIAWFGALLWPRTEWGDRLYSVPLGGKARIVGR